MKGFTLVEFLFSLFIGSLVILAVFSISIQSSSTLHKSAVICNAQNNANYALEKISTKVRGAYDIRVYDAYASSFATTNLPGKYLWIVGSDYTSGFYLANSKLYFVPNINDDQVPLSTDDYLLANNLVDTNIFSFDDLNLSIDFDIFTPNEKDKIILNVDTIIHPRNI